MGIPAAAHDAIRTAWNAEPPALYGRLDLAYDGDTIKLLEYNADTPTALVEAAVVQWYWLQDCFPDADQFNSAHEKLIAKWKDLKDYTTSPLYFADAGSEEDRMTTAYLEDTAQQAGIKTRHIRMHDIGWDAGRSAFVDLDNHVMGTLFKLYPWEWLLAEPFGANALSTLPPRITAARIRPAQRPPHVGIDAVDRADLEDDVVEQGAAGDPVGTEPGARAAFALVYGWTA